MPSENYSDLVLKTVFPRLYLYCLFCGSQDICCPHSQWQLALCTAADWAWVCVTWDFLTDDALHILLSAMDQSSTQGNEPTKPPLSANCFPILFFLFQLCTAETSGDGSLFCVASAWGDSCKVSELLPSQLSQGFMGWGHRVKYYCCSLGISFKFPRETNATAVVWLTQRDGEKKMTVTIVLLTSYLTACRERNM